MKSSHILGPLAVKSQAPLDGKSYETSLSELSNLGPRDHKAFTYYEGMEVYCNEDKNTYVWKDTAGIDIEGLIIGGFTYPTNSDSFGTDYSGRTFNFFEEDELTANLTSSDDSIKVEGRDLTVNTEGWALDVDFDSLTPNIDL